MKKLLALVLAVMMLIASCAALAEAPEGYPEVKEGIDFGGATIYFYDYWSGTDWHDQTDRTEEQEDQAAYRTWIEETYNCTVITIQKGDWGSNMDELVNFAGAPDGSLCLFCLAPDFVGTPMANGILAPWAVDLDDPTWNAADIDFMTKNGVCYGVATGHAEPRQCLYFNKRVLEEAGIEWNTIYDMQAAGTWTWAAWEEMLQATTSDVDADGVLDLYGMTGSNFDMFLMAVFNNGVDFFHFDEEGKLVIGVNNEKGIEALDWAQRIWNQYGYKQPSDGQWDYYKDAWKQGFCAFYMYQTYGGFNDNSEMSDMADEWGCVAFPVPNEGDTYYNITSDNIWCMPNVYDEKTAADIQYIFYLWNQTTPGYDDEDAWIGNKYNFTDDRAVDETYAMLREGDHCKTNKTYYLGSNNDILGQDFLWSLWGEADVNAVMEAKLPVWQGLIDTFNGK
ncbi:MAG: hypothetical protein CW338_06815 [Clostridiales bacterium]|nr:hypothetical protein [Clostridiales bacterium]